VFIIKSQIFCVQSSIHAAKGNKLLVLLLLLPWQEPKEEVNKLLLTKVSGRDQNVKDKQRLVVLAVIFI